MYRFNSRKYVLTSICVLLLLVTLVLCVNFLRSDTASVKKNFDGLRLAVLDGERLKAEAICFKSHEKIAQMVADVLSKVKESESQIKEEYEKIKSSKKLTQEQKLSETAKIEAKWNTVFTRYNAEIQSIRNKDLLLSEHIQRKLTSIIDAITRSAKLDVVVNKGNRDIILVFHNSKDIDITDLVICRLNKEVPSVDIGGIKDD